MQQLLELGPTPSPIVAHLDPPRDRGDATAASAKQALPSRNASSKSDFVKIMVSRSFPSRGMVAGSGWVTGERRPGGEPEGKGTAC